ncbi:DUF736 family protein [Xanthobacter sp. DSM 14520]|uniref:DUF736 family protein n=1 Tax=Xanthobacter autotrophicus (strain ATCC BAA-1158 / Py2) TaxID=78245 RepID=UPI003726D3A5
MADQKPNTIEFDEKREHAIGWIATAWCDFQFEAEMDREARNTNRPLYRVLGRSPKGTPIEIGAIWERKSRETGNLYLSIQIRDTGVEGREFNGNIGRLPGSHTSNDDQILAIIESRPLAA